MTEILVVGGTWDRAGGRRSKIVDSLADFSSAGVAHQLSRYKRTT